MKCIGIMTGNSLDAVDVVLTDFSNTGITDLCGHSKPIPPQMADDFRSLKTALCQNHGDIATIHQQNPHKFLALHNAYVALVAEAVQELIAQSGVAAEDIAAVGFHGQTCYHRPPSICAKGEKPRTIQIGSGQMLADILKLPVVFDFRSADILNGGEGAPLAPLHNQHLAEKLQQQGILPVAFCNGGNTGNIAIISQDLNNKDIQCVGWDTGPFNHFADYLARTEKNLPCDLDGQIGRAGQINYNLLRQLFEHAVTTAQGENFLLMPPPKSSDPAWYTLIPELTDQTIPLADRMRTAEFFSAYIFVYSLRHIPFNLYRPKHFLLFGGGWRNPIIYADFCQILRGQARVLPQHINIFKALSCPEAVIAPADKFGISGRYMEARIFADMAKCFLNSEPFTLPTTTGCKKPTVCGTLAKPGGGNTQLWSKAA